MTGLDSDVTRALTWPARQLRTLLASDDIRDGFATVGAEPFSKAK